jgi:predicted SnoaL-like aldol condensation-catalyzing enzyme
VTVTEQTTDAAQLQKNLDSFYRFLDETVTRKNLAAIDELTTPDFVEHGVPPGFPPNREGTKQFFGMLLGGFPDVSYEIEDLIVQGDRLAARILWRGTQTGEFMGSPPSGKVITVQSIEWLRMEDSKLAEHWGLNDDLGMLQQLGLIPAPGGEQG